MARRKRRQRLTLPAKRKTSVSKVTNWKTVSSVEDDPFYEKWRTLVPMSHFVLRKETFHKDDRYVLRLFCAVC